MVCSQPMNEQIKSWLERGVLLPNYLLGLWHLGQVPVRVAFKSSFNMGRLYTGPVSLWFRRCLHEDGSTIALLNRFGV